MKCIVLFVLFILFGLWLLVQIIVELIVIDVVVIIICDDFFLVFDFFWQVEVENQGIVIYLVQGFCYIVLFNVQYIEDFNCFNDLFVIIEVCFMVFENDLFILIGCFIDCLCEE